MSGTVIAIQLQAALIQAKIMQTRKIAGGHQQPACPLLAGLLLALELVHQLPVCHLVLPAAVQRLLAASTVL
jgi:hypothetical protein